MRIHMYTSASWLERYKNGEVAWGVSAEGRVDYPYMNIHVDVDDYEVVGMERKEIPVRDGDDRKTEQMREFMSYDIQKLV